MTRPLMCVGGPLNGLVRHVQPRELVVPRGDGDFFMFPENLNGVLTVDTALDGYYLQTPTGTLQYVELGLPDAPKPGGFSMETVDSTRTATMSPAHAMPYGSGFTSRLECRRCVGGLRSRDSIYVKPHEKVVMVGMGEQGTTRSVFVSENTDVAYIVGTVLGVYRQVDGALHWEAV